MSLSHPDIVLVSYRVCGTLPLTSIIHRNSTVQMDASPSLFHHQGQSTLSIFYANTNIPSPILPSDVAQSTQAHFHNPSDYPSHIASDAIVYDDASIIHLPSCNNVQAENAKDGDYEGRENIKHWVLAMTEQSLRPQMSPTTYKPLSHWAAVSPSLW